MARSNIPLPDPRGISALTVRIRHLKPDLGWPDLEGPGQRVMEKSSSTMLLAAATARRPILANPMINRTKVVFVQMPSSRATIRK